MKWQAKFKPLRRLTEEERKYTLVLSLGKVKGEKCHFCGGYKTDCCYNCELPICEKCAILFAFTTLPDGSPSIVLGICPECVRDNNLKVREKNARPKNNAGAAKKGRIPDN